MELSETDRNRLRLWRRWQITFDWFGYPPPMQRVHQALLIHRRLWSTRALATYTNLPQTSVRRQLREMDKGRTINYNEDGFEISELGAAFAISFHKEIAIYVRGGCKLNEQLLNILKQGPSTEHMAFDMLESHIWWPVIEAPDIDDA